MSDATFQRLMQVAERLGVPTLFYLLLLLIVWRVLKWIGERLVEVGHFVGPLIRSGVQSHTRFLDTTSEELPRSTGALGEIRDWLKSRWPPPANSTAKGAG